MDKIFSRKFPRQHAWFHRISDRKIQLFSPCMSKVSKMRNSIDCDEISSQEKKKRSVDKVIGRLSRFPPTNRIRKEGKLLRFELLLVLKFNSHPRYLRGKVEATQVSFRRGRTWIWAESIVADYYGGCARHLAAEF